MREHGHFMEYLYEGSEIIFSAGPDAYFINKHGFSFITNLDTIDNELYKHIIRVYYKTIDNKAAFFISKYATDIYGNDLKGHYSLWGRNYDKIHFTALWKHFKEDYKDTGFIKRNEFCVA